MGPIWRATKAMFRPLAGFFGRKKTEESDDDKPADEEQGKGKNVEGETGAPSTPIAASTNKPHVTVEPPQEVNVPSLEVTAPDEQKDQDVPTFKVDGPKD